MRGANPRWVIALGCAAVLLYLAAGCACPFRSVCPAAPVACTSLVGKAAPDFAADAVMPDDTVARLSLADLGGHYALVFFYPADFSYVCPTEVIAFDEHLAEFDALDCRVVGISVDRPKVHLAWKATSRDDGGVGPVRYPLVSDVDGAIARSYCVLGPDGRAMRAWFLLGPSGKVRHMLVNEPALGRSVAEALRLVAAARTVDEFGELCPVDWQPGEATVGPTPGEVPGGPAAKGGKQG